jgi:uncharacterized protein
MLDQLKADIKTSLLAGDRFRTDVLKMAQAALLNARIAKGVGVELDDKECVAVVQKEIKKRYEARDMYASAGSHDKADTEEKEARMLEAYVPSMLSGKELLDAIEAHLSGKDLSTLSFAVVMKECIDTLGNIDKGQLAVILKQKLAK